MFWFDLCMHFGKYVLISYVDCRTAELVGWHGHLPAIVAISYHWWWQLLTACCITWWVVCCFTNWMINLSFMVLFSMVFHVFFYAFIACYYLTTFDAFIVLNLFYSFINLICVLMAWWWNEDMLKCSVRCTCHMKRYIYEAVTGLWFLISCSFMHAINIWR